jgi:hypothetical protein
MCGASHQRMGASLKIVGIFEFVSLSAIEMTLYSILITLDPVRHMKHLSAIFSRNSSGVPPIELSPLIL